MTVCVLCCSSSPIQAHGMYPNEHRLKERCFSGSYVLHLLEHGFGFNASSPHDWRLKFVGTVRQPFLFCADKSFFVSYCSSTCR